jgi:hypothetical protein
MPFDIRDDNYYTKVSMAADNVRVAFPLTPLEDTENAVVAYYGSMGMEVPEHFVRDVSATIRRRPNR